MLFPEYMLFHEYIGHWAAQYPERVAIYDGEITITYRELDEQSNQLLCGLQAWGIVKGNQIVTVLPPSYEYILLLAAASKLGAIIVPFDVRYRDEDFSRFLPLTDPALVITMPVSDDYCIVETLQSQLDASDRLVSTQNYASLPVFSALFGDSSAYIQDTIGIDDPLLLIFTGGTTGHPKGALLAHRQIIQTSKMEYETIFKYTTYNVEQGAATLAALPPSHIGGSVEIIIGSLMAGLSLVCQSSWHPVHVLEATVKYRMPIIAGVPAMFHILLSLPLETFDLTSVKVVVLSGDKVSSALVREIQSRLCAKVIVSYGLTEANVLTFSSPDDPVELFDDGYAGIPIADVKMKIDSTVQPDSLPETALGELLVHSPSMIDCYYQLPEETNVSFTEGYFRTGDLGRLDSQNRLFIEGRIKQIIRVGSYTVLPSEIEDFVAKQPGVLMVAALGIPHKVLGEAVCLIVSLAANSAHTSESLTKLCTENMADYKVPRHIFIREEIPLTRIGKIDKYQLRREILRHLPSDT